MKRSVSVLDAMSDPKLFGSQFEGGSWAAWRSFLGALFGLRLSAADLELYRRHTGRERAPPGPFGEAYAIVGRRGGKSRVASAVAVYLAALRDYREYLAPGEVATVMILAQDRKQARVVYGYCKGLLDSVPLLASMVKNVTAEGIELNNRTRIEIHTSSFRSVRGYSLAAVIADEVAFWRSEESTDPDVEVVRAVLPGLASMPGSLLLGISSPYSRRGVLWDAHRKHHGNESSVLVWQADTRSMNPLIAERIIADAYESDPIAASAEFGALFRSDVEGFASLEAVSACVVPGRYELPRTSGVRYVGFCDPSGGSRDSFTMAVAHREKDLAVLDCVREVRPPFSPEAVVVEFSGLLKSYGMSQVTGDRYAGEWVNEQFRKHGIRYEPSAKSKSDIYRDLLPQINSGRVALLDNDRLTAQLVGLERRTSRAGRDSVDHPPNSHDDLINAAAGALVMAVGAPKGRFMLRFSGSSGGSEQRDAAHRNPARAEARASLLCLRSASIL